MNSSSVRTTWITMFSIFMMLFSSFASASMPMVSQVMSVESAACNDTSPCHGMMQNNTDHVMHKSVTDDNTESDCEMHSDDQMVCGTSSCSVYSAILLSDIDDFALTSTQLFIPFEVNGAIASHASSLYRPPIA